jgi:hypothetical protein
MAKYTIPISDLASHLQSLRECQKGAKSNPNAVLIAAASGLSISTLVNDLDQSGSLSDIWRTPRQKTLFLRIFSQAHVLFTFYSRNPYLEDAHRAFFRTCADTVKRCLEGEAGTETERLIEKYADTPAIKARRRRSLRNVDEQFIAAVLSSPAKYIIPSLNEILKVFSHRTRKRFLAEIQRKSDRIRDFLRPCSGFSDASSSRAVLLNLREWNSYTPSVPSSERMVRGGGYFIRYQGQGIVIDPGYDFIRNLCEAGGRIFDIDHIVVTHAHDDHTHDFESLLSLLHQYNQQNKAAAKRAHLYLGQSAERKFSGYLRLRGVPYISGVEILNPGRKDNPQRLPLHRLQGAELTVLPAYHDDVIALDYSVGLGFRFWFGSVSRTVAFTADTGLYPTKRNKENEAVRDKNGQMKVDVGDGISRALYNVYPTDYMEPDLLVAHIGSIKDYEFREVPADAFAKAPGLPLFYPNHLGCRGLALFLTNLRPKAVVVGEFGEELGDIRFDLVRGISRFLRKQGRTGKDSVFVVPSDFTVLYDIEAGKFLCHQTMDFRPPNELEFVECDQTKDTMFHCDGVKRTYLFVKPSPKNPADRAVCVDSYYAYMRRHNRTLLSSLDRFH